MFRFCGSLVTIAFIFVAGCEPNDAIKKDSSYAILEDATVGDVDAGAAGDSAGISDAAMADAVMADAAMHDAAMADAAMADAAMADAVVPDAVVPDAVVPDAVVPDAVVSDLATLSDTHIPDSETPVDSRMGPDATVAPDSSPIVDAAVNDDAAPTDADVNYDATPLAYSIDPEIARYDEEKTNWLEFTVDGTGLASPLTFSTSAVTLAGENTAIPDGVTLDETTGEFAWSPSPSQSGVYLFYFEVTDNAGQTTTRVVQITVVTPEICSGSSQTCNFLQAWYLNGTAAGNVGDWYHNSDKFHSNLGMSLFPQADLMWTYQYTYQTRVTEGRVIIGNSSTAYTQGDSWRSNMRAIMLSSYSSNSVYQQYINNNHYWYPEHRDHDDTDHYHGKTATVSSAQGSSGWEMDEVKKWMYTFAAYKPAVKRTLVDAGLLIPTTQMIFRRVRVADDAAYLTGAAHPSAFDNHSGTQQMVEMANAIEASNIPPMVQLDVVAEDFTMVDGKNEVQYTTPVSICRIFRGMVYTRQMEVSAQASYDHNGLPLTYHWAVLRGDPAHVRITPQNGDGSVVVIEFDYHPQTTVGESTLLTNMVEVGAFVHNGHYYSAPAFVTSFTLNNEERTYDNSGTLTDIQYNSNYVHPNLL